MKCVACIETVSLLGAHVGPWGAMAGPWGDAWEHMGSMGDHGAMWGPCGPMGAHGGPWVLCVSGCVCVLVVCGVLAASWRLIAIE